MASDEETAKEDALDVVPQGVHVRELCSEVVWRCGGGARE